MKKIGGCVGIEQAQNRTSRRHNSHVYPSVVDGPSASSEIANSWPSPPLSSGTAVDCLLPSPPFPYLAIATRATRRTVGHSSSMSLTS